MIVVTMKDKKFDTSDLARFSDDVRFVHDSNLYPDDADDMMPLVVFKAHAVLRTFDPKTDYIALAGDPLVCAAVMATAGRSFSTLRVLKFDKRERAYYPVWINTKPIPEAA